MKETIKNVSKQSQLDKIQKGSFHDPHSSLKLGSINITQA
jgi:hypothetical protein